MKSDCILRDLDCDSVLYLQCWEVQPVRHKTFLAWIRLVILSQCKQILNANALTLTKSSTWANSLSPWAHMKSLSFIVMAFFFHRISTVLSIVFTEHTTNWTGATADAPVPLCAHVWHLYCLSGYSLISRSACLCVCVSVFQSVLLPFIYTTCLTAVRPAFSLSLCLKPLCLPCQGQWDRRRRDVMATLSDSPQILHALTGLDCGWAFKLPATIRDTSERMGLTPWVISQIKPVGGSAGQTSSLFTLQ